MTHHVIPLGRVFVMMVGPSGAGKTTIAKSNFKNGVVSTDDIREWMSGADRMDKIMEVHHEAHRRCETMLKMNRRVVLDSTNLHAKDRISTLRKMKALGATTVEIIVNRPLEEKIETGGWRLNTIHRGKNLIESHDEIFNSMYANMKKEADIVIDLTKGDTFEVVEELDVSCPIDDIMGRGYGSVRVYGDIHGDFAEFEKNYDPMSFSIFLGDIVDGGPKVWETVEQVHDIVLGGMGVLIHGNHDLKLARYFKQIANGGEFKGKIGVDMQRSLDQIKMRRNPDKDIANFLELVEYALPWLNFGEYMFVHGSAHPDMFNMNIYGLHHKSRLHQLAIYGTSDGTFTPEGFPNRTYDWVDDVPGGKTVVVGHSIRDKNEPLVVSGAQGGKVIFLDTGCGKGGRLSTMPINLTQL